MKLTRVLAIGTLLTMATAFSTETTARADEPSSPSSGGSGASATTPPNTEQSGGGGSAAIAVSAPSNNNTPLALPMSPPAHEEKSSLLPLVLAGTGLAFAAVGGILIAAAPKTPESCNSDLHTCVRQPGQSADDFANDQDRAGRAHTMPVMGWLTIGLGGMLVVAGGLTYLFGSENGGHHHHHRGAATTTPPRLAPYAGPNGGGLVAVGTF